jgi:hypothetical protein
MMYRIPETKLRKYATTKSDANKKNFKRPLAEFIDQTYHPDPDFKFSIIQNALATPTAANGE